MKSRSRHLASAAASRHTDAHRKPSAPTAVLYARVSTAEQEREGFSIPAQVELLRNYAQQQGIDILEEFIDIESAANCRTPANPTGPCDRSRRIETHEHLKCSNARYISAP